MRTAMPLLIASAVALAPPANASITQVSTSHNIEYQQTGMGAVSLAGTFFSADLILSPEDLSTSGSVTYPGGSQTLLPVSPGSTDLGFQTGLLADQSALDAAFPTGTYTFATSGGDSFATNIPGKLYSAEIPEIANFDALATLDPNQAFTFDLTGGFTPQGTEAFTFFTVFDTTANSLVYSDGFASPTTTAFTVGANTFTSGHTYQFETIFDNRYSFSGGGDPAAFHLFDTRTFGDFSLASAVPEPATWAMMVGGFGAVGGSMRARRRKARLTTA